MKRKVLGALLLAGVLAAGMSAAAFAVPEKAKLETEASSTDVKKPEETNKSETVDTEVKTEEKTEVKTESSEKTETKTEEKSEEKGLSFIPKRTARSTASDSVPEQTTEEYVYPNVYLREAEVNGTKGVYPYWDKYEGPGEPAGVAVMTVRYTDDGYINCGNNIEAYGAERSFVTDGNQFRLVMPIAFNGNGVYQTYVVYVMKEELIPDNLMLPDDVWNASKSMSESYEYEIPAERTPVPGNVEADEIGRLSWDVPEGVKWFNIALRNTDDPDFWVNTYIELKGSSLTTGRAEGYYSEYFANRMNPGGTYYYSICAISPDSTMYADSEYVNSNTFTIPENNDIIEDVLSKEGKELVAAVDNQKLNSGQMYAMKRDLTNNAVAETSYEELNEKYRDAAGLSALEKGSSNNSFEEEEIRSIKVVGDALNQITSIDFSRLNEEEAAEQNINDYKNAVCVEITASAEDEEKSELQWPILITMNAPEGIPISFLRIAHYRSDGEVETLRPRDNGDGTISFAIDHFSLFVFYEMERQSSSSGGGSYSGPVGVYFADGRNSAAKTSGTWQQDSTGWKYMLSNGHYPTNTWYECDWNGQKLWYHFNAEGYVDSGWFTDTDGNTYYLHPLHDGNFGYMYTGWNTIEGKNYYFSMDSASGILKGALLKGTVTPDGRTVGADGVLIG